MAGENKLRIDWAFVSLFTLLFIINVPFLLGVILPRHDTLSGFQTFYFFYNEFFFSNELARWVPFGFYGVQSDYFLITYLSPSNYLAAIIGLLVRTENVLFLFSLSSFFDQLILLFGSYLLGRSVFKDKTTAVFVCVIVICSTVLFRQYYLNFRIYCYLPLVIYFITLFFSRSALKYLLVAAIVFVLSLCGNAPYMFPVQALVIAIIFFTLLIANRTGLGAIAQMSRRDIFQNSLLLILLAALGGTYYYYISHAMDLTEGLYVGRDALTMRTDLETFLTFGEGKIGFSKFMGLVYPSPGFVRLDLTVHVGYIALIFAIYAVLFVRQAVFAAFSAVVLVLGLLSLGTMTPVAKFLYNYFPMMDYYRHIGHVVSMYKLFLPFIAGFGLEHFMGRFDLAPNAKADVQRTPVVAGSGLDHPPGRLDLSPNAKADVQRTSVKISRLLAEAVLAVLVLAGTFIYSSLIVPTLVLPTMALTTAFVLSLIFLRQYHSPQHHNPQYHSPKRRFAIFVISCVCFQVFRCSLIRPSSTGPSTRCTGLRKRGCPRGVRPR